MESVACEPGVIEQQQYLIPEVTCSGSSSSSSSSSSSTRMRMLAVGMGTASYPFAGSEGVKQALLHAIKLGYRHFDTASFYQTEQSLGEVISEAIQLGLIKSREELFITSKLWCSDSHSDLVLPALIHFPISLKPGRFDFPVQSKEDLLPMDLESELPMQM